MQYMSFAPAGSVHSKASAIFARNFVFCKYTKCYRKCKCPAGKKHTRAAALSHIHTLKSCHKITLGLCQIAAHTSEKNIRYDIICRFTVDLQ